MQAFRLLLFRREFLDLPLGLGFEVDSLLLGLLHQLIPALLGGDPGQSPLRSRGFDEFRALFLRGGDEFLAGALRLGAEVFSLFGDLFRERLAAREFLYLLVDDVLHGLLGGLPDPEGDLRRGERAADVHADRLERLPARNGHPGLVVDGLVKPRRTREVDVHAAHLQIEGLRGDAPVLNGETNGDIPGLDFPQVVVAQRLGQGIERLDILHVDIGRLDLARSVERPQVGRHGGVERRAEVE